MPLRIAIDVRRFKDFGVGTYIRNLLNSLEQIDRINQYFLVARPQDANDLQGLPDNFHLHPYTARGARWQDEIAYPMFLRGLKADLFHIPSDQVPLFMPNPYVVTIHDMSALLFERTPGLRSSLRLFRIRRGLVKADRLIAVSDATRRDVETLLGIPSRRIRLIYNAPDPRFRQARRPADARAAGPEMYMHERRRILERYQINYPFLLYAGAIRQQKNIPRLVEAFAVLRNELEAHPIYKELRLIIIGDEISRYPAVRHAVIQTRSGPYVRFLGFVPFDTLRIFYEAAAAFVFPSLYEGFGLPPLEAMACGTPVISSHVSSLPEVVGDAAMIVNPEKVFDIARGIKEVLLDSNLRSRLTRKGYEQAEKFSWNRTAEQVLATYLEVGGLSPAP